MKKIVTGFFCFCFVSISFSQELFIPRDIQKAIDNGSRSLDGNPGKNYFQNRADYIIEAEFDPGSRILKGNETIEYKNNSTVKLRYVVIRLYQNVFKKGTIRGRPMDPDDINDGVKITSLTINGKEFDLEKDRWFLHQTFTNVYLPFDCLPGKNATIKISWEFTMPSKPNDRFGGYNENSFFMGYWFPQVSVFDDINGWDIFDYTAVAEFYNEYGNFDVKIRVPENYIVWATGLLQNPQDVLQKKYLSKFTKAQKSEDVVSIIGRQDRKPGNYVTNQGENTWHFTAADVNDFAFGTSSTYLWDAASIKTKSGKKVLVQSAYDPKTLNFSQVVEIAGWSIKTLENDVVGVEYPYPSMTGFNGDGGMEYPMIINDHDGNLSETIFVTTHEIAHTYFPFMVGTNQRRHGWLDEGLSTMLGMEAHSVRDSQTDLRKTYTDFYPLVAGTQMDIPQSVNSADLNDNIFQLHEYVRPSLGFWTLQDIMGKEMFRDCLVEFINRWAGKHPTPWDFFFTCNHVTGKDYSWFFEPWFNRNSYTDLAISSGSFDNNVLEITLENKGGMPFPSSLKINYMDDSTENMFIPADKLGQSKKYSIKLHTEKKVKNVLLDTSGYPDCDTGNNLIEF